MKRRGFLSTTAAGLTGVTAASCAKRPSEPVRTKLFSFIHFTDIHVHPESGATEGFLQAIEKMNSVNPDFVVSGGDLQTDVLAADEERANMLYDLYIKCCENFDAPIYDTIGNHEIFGITVPDKVSENHPDWGKEMYKRRLGNGSTYMSFDHKGVHFLLLDSMGIEKRENAPGHRYFGEIGAEQMSWINNDLAALPENSPVIATVHIPLFTLMPQIQNGLNSAAAKPSVITDGLELYELLTTQRLFGVFQGHHHVNETYIYKNTKFIESAAVCGAWWSGPKLGHPEGFSVVDVYDDGIESEYVTYGWDASQYKQQALDPDIFPYAHPVLV